MPEPTKIPRPFADSGDKNSIPDSSGSIGFASWQEGFPAITSEPFAQGGVAPKRADFNGVFNALSAATVWNQQGGVYAYDNTTDYEVGNVVEYSGDLYKCLVANGPNSAVKAPTDSTVWDAIATASGYLPLSGGTLTGNLSVNGLQLTGTKRIYGNNTNDVVRMSGGSTDATDGASIALYGAGQSWSGHFFLQAKNASDSMGLHGYPNGTLLWGSDNVATIQTGTWTPTLAGEMTTGVLTYSTRTGVYVKLGRFVAIMGQVVVSAITTQPVGYCILSGLPYVLSGPAVIPIRGINGQNSCARKVIHASQNSSGTSELRIQGVNPSSIASTGQIENLRWSASDSSADYLMFGSSAPRMEIDICGCYMTTA